MINRRTALGLIASAGAIGAPGLGYAKEKHHLNGQALLGGKIKQNGKHKIHTAGKADVFAEVNNGKVVGVSATGMQVKKVKSRQKLAGTTPSLILMAKRSFTTSQLKSMLSPGRTRPAVTTLLPVGTVICGIKAIAGI